MVLRVEERRAVDGALELGDRFRGSPLLAEHEPEAVVGLGEPRREPDGRRVRGGRRGNVVLALGNQPSEVIGLARFRIALDRLIDRCPGARHVVCLQIGAASTEQGGDRSRRRLCG